MSSLIDPFGRSIHYARLSVTDRCDFRCVYCMAETMQFLPKGEVLSLEELLAVARALIATGIDHLRITGGEPLVRRDLLWLIERIGKLPGLKELTLSTNGSRLAQYADALRQHGVSRVNISIDSLNPKKFKSLTRTGELSDVLTGIAAAKHARFKAIKLNSVILKNRNDDDILPLVDFAVNNQLDISFIEEMPLGHITEHNRALAFMSSDEVRELIEQSFSLVDSDKKTNGPSRYVKVQGSSTHIGFISPHSHNFCSSCNRVRVTAEGKLLLCLGNENAVDLRQLLRSSSDEVAATKRLTTAISRAIRLKPEQHHFNLDDDPDIVRFMNLSGG